MIDCAEDYRMDQHAAEVDADCGHSIGIFSRTQQLPGDDMDAEDAAEAMAQLKRDNPRLFAVVEQHIAAEREEASRDVMANFSAFLMRVFSWCVLPVPCPAKAWGLVYALDLGLHDEVSPAEMARRLGMSRAALSCQIQSAAKLLGLPPSRWMRAESVVINTTAARRVYVESSAS